MSARPPAAPPADDPAWGLRGSEAIAGAGSFDARAGAQTAKPLSLRSSHAKHRGFKARQLSRGIGANVESTLDVVRYVVRSLLLGLRDGSKAAPVDRRAPHAAEDEALAVSIRTGVGPA
jgi:hypothetical protein